MKVFAIAYEELEEYDDLFSPIPGILRTKIKITKTKEGIEEFIKKHKFKTQDEDFVTEIIEEIIE